MPTTTTLHRLARQDTDRQEHHHARPLAVMGAVSATLAVWLVAHPLAGVDLTLRSSAGNAIHQVSPASVATATVLAGLGACGLLAALEHVARRPRRIWLKIACAALVLSLVGPIALGQTNAAIATLVSMHLAAAGVLIPSLARSTRAPARSAAANPN